MLVKYDEFIQKVKEAKTVRVIGSFYIDRTSEIYEVLKCVRTLEEKSAGIVFEPLYYTTKNINDTGILLGIESRKNLQCVEVERDVTEIITVDGKFYSLASCDFMTVLEIE